MAGADTVQKLWPSAWHWWMDAVGGFACFRTQRVPIGRPRTGLQGIEILGDLSGRHAEIVRDADGYALDAVEETFINETPATHCRLRHGDRIRMRNVVLEYRQPCTWRQSAQLTILSRHRMPLALDGVLLMGDAFWVGGVDSLIRSDWSEEIKLIWSVTERRYWVQSSPPLRVDGKLFDRWGPLEPTSRVQGPWGSFRFEPVVST